MRHGLDRLQLDIAWITIRTLEKLGLAWNVHLPSESQRARRRLAGLEAVGLKSRDVLLDAGDPRPGAREPQDRP